jgi:hypothetical protein
MKRRRAFQWLQIPPVLRIVARGADKEDRAAA